LVLRAAIDYLVVRRGDRSLLKKVRWIWEKDCVSQHRLLIGDFALRGWEKCKRKYVPRLKTWRLRDETVRSRYATANATREKEVYDVADLNGKWEGMKKACLETTEVCGWTKGPQRHKETWWWNEDVKRTVLRHGLALSRQTIGQLMLRLGTVQRR
jgi:hypothetical protein